MYVFFLINPSEAKKDHLLILDGRYQAVYVSFYYFLQFRKFYNKQIHKNPTILQEFVLINGFQVRVLPTFSLEHSATKQWAFQSKPRPLKVAFCRDRWADRYCPTFSICFSMKFRKCFLGVIFTQHQLQKQIVAINLLDAIIVP